MRRMVCYGECGGRETSHEWLGEDDEGYEIWQCTVCGQRSDYSPPSEENRAELG